MNTVRKIVVGIDGSQSSINALTWALHEAKRHSAAVHVVHVWSLPLAVDPMGGVIFSPVEEFRSAAEGVLKHTIDTVKSLVGRRGHGGFLGLLIGSVAEQIAHHAKCPAVIVPL